MDYIDYVILDNYIQINGIEYGDFVFVTRIDDNIANVNISNTEIYFNVVITDNGLHESVKNFFKNNIEV